MIIGVDCDGVLTDMSAYIYKYGEKWFKRKPTNPDGYSTAEIFGCTDKEEFRFGLRYFFTYCKKWPPREGAVEVIRKLNNDGHKLYEITARKFVTMHNPLGWYSRYLYVRWAKKYEFVFEDTFYCSESNAAEDKLNGCRKCSAEIMIEDRPIVAMHLAENNVKVLLFDARYNQDVSHENITRVYDWNDVYDKINTLERT